MAKRSDNGVEHDGAHDAARPGPFPKRDDLPESAPAPAEIESAVPALEVAPASVVTATPEQQTAEFYNLLGQGEALLASFALKIPFAVAQEIFVFSEDEKKALVPPTARVIQKHAPWLLQSKYADEFQVVSILGWLTYSKIRAAIETAKRLNLATPTKEGATAPAPAESVSELEPSAPSEVVEAAA